MATKKDNLDEKIKVEHLRVLNGKKRRARMEKEIEEYKRITSKPNSQKGRKNGKI